MSERIDALKLVRFSLPLALLLLLSLPPPAPPGQMEHLPEPGPVVQVIPFPVNLKGQEGTGEDQEEAAPPPDGNVIEDCIVTYYDVCVLCCGKDDGITASGAVAVPYETCAVDPAVIPLGSTVLMDYGDGTVLHLRAEDTGSGVRGNHVDVCVAGHEEALALGTRRATVYWEEE